MIQQRLSQKNLQKLSPQQIQIINLLQIPAASLEQRIKEELEANPALEEGDNSEDENTETLDDREDEYEEDEVAQEDMEMDEFIEEYIDDDPMTYQQMSLNNSEEDDKRESPVTVGNTFHEHLIHQLGMLNFEDKRREAVALQIIGSIDEDGYLRRDPLSIVDDLIFSANIETNEKEVLSILTKIQEFDPPGIGARDLRECLLIQLKKKLKEHDVSEIQADHRLIALKILKDYFDEFSKKHYSKLQKYLEITEDELRYAIGEILKLNPKPASSYLGAGSSINHYVIPDFIIENKEGDLSLRLNNRNSPDLQINKHYRDMLEDFQKRKEAKKVSKKDKEAVLFIKQKIDSARWFIDAIRQRQQTMYHTMYAIMQYQYEYFLTGDSRKIRPMILKDIAELTGLDVSTVSRVANSKFVQTEFGTRKLKDFFSESIQTKSGEDVSTLEVKKILSDIVDAENKKKPLSDEKLKMMLQEKGYDIARRTVAKYREQLGIPVARLRKEL
ncbi:MAG: RNA polymerase sigma-54 factor [Saprospirales bacterium]|nr:MAG: RNA polymerase sigma-54 factor [Saprospirales bacterium]